MADPDLHGNHDPCPACELRREALGKVPIPHHNPKQPHPESVPCNVCGGTGYLKLSDAEIVQRTCDEARRIYWPIVEARWAAQNGVANA